MNSQKLLKYVLKKLLALMESEFSLPFS